jgi:hypothetical protein
MYTRTPVWFSFPMLRRDSSVGIVTRLRAGRSGVDFWHGQFFSTASKLTLGPTRRPIQWVPRVLSPMVKLAGRKADHSPPFSSELSAWSYTSTPLYVLLAWYLVKHTGTTLPLPSCVTSCFDLWPSFSGDTLPFYVNWWFSVHCL